MKIEQIKDIIESHFEIDLNIKNRQYDVIKVRFFYYHCCYTYANEFLTYDKVGKSIGFNHATVIYGLKEFKNIYNSDQNFKRQCMIVENILIDKCENFIDESDFQLKKKEFIFRRIEQLKKMIF